MKDPSSVPIMPSAKRGSSKYNFQSLCIAIIQPTRVSLLMQKKILIDGHCISAVYPDLPRTITREWQDKEVRRMVDLGSGAVTGVASKWDYEKGQWKN